MELKQKARGLMFGSVRDFFERRPWSRAKPEPKKFSFDELVEGVAPGDRVVFTSPPQIIEGRLAVLGGRQEFPLRDIDSVVFYPSPRKGGEIDMIVTKDDGHDRLIDVYAGSFSGDNQILEATERLLTTIGISSSRFLIPRKRKPPSPSP